MNSTQKRCADRLRKLIEERNNIVVEKGSNEYIVNTAFFHAWLTKVENIIEIAFGDTSPHYKKFRELTNDYINYNFQIDRIEGLLVGSLDDLENGFLTNQEFLIAGEIFDSVLEEAKHILDAGYKDPAAVLGRVVLEDSLKRLAREEQIDDAKKASVLNEELKKAGRYNQPQWRQIQVWLDIGNDAAHGNFNNYTKEQVKDQIDGIERFIASDFKV